MIRDIKRGMNDGIPIALGYLSVSFTFGLMAVSAGMKWWQAVLISVFNLTSAGQFAGLDIMLAGGSLFEMALSQLVINMRYSLMSLSLSQKVNKAFDRKKRSILAMGITDEIFAVSMGQKEKVSAKYMAGVVTVSYAGWAGGTCLGAVLGDVLPAVLRDSLGIAIYGMFLAIIIPKAKEDNKTAVVIVAAVLLSTVFYYVPVLKQVSSGFVIIICAVIASALGAWLFPTETEE